MNSSTETTTLSEGQQTCLRCIAGHMIPPSDRLGVPGADDPAIAADMVAGLQRDRQALARILEQVDTAAGGRLADLDPAAREALLGRLRAADPAGFAIIEAVIVRAYYRDDRVLAAIGMEPRPPFPKGYDVPATDWSLLDPVRARGSICRPAE